MNAKAKAKAKAVNRRWNYWKGEMHKIGPVQPVWKAHTHKHKLAIVLIEFRKHELIAPVIRSAANVYGQEGDVSLIIIHGRQNKEYIEEIVAGWTNVKLIELEYDNIDRLIYSKILTKVSFWEQFISEFILIIQTDAVCLKALNPALFQYSYVGAPWFALKLHRSHSRIGNGGYSLRNVAAMIQICQQHNYSEKKDMAEDVFFSKYLQLKDLPNLQLAKQFSVESIFHPTPSGSHRGWLFNNDKEIEKLLEPIKHMK